MAKTTTENKNDNIIKIFYMMLNNRNGISYQDIMDEFGVSRKTAERYIKCICDNFGEHMIDEIQPEWEKQKRWGFINYYPKQLAHFSKREIAIMELFKSFEPLQKYRSEIDVIIEKMKINIFNK